MAGSQIPTENQHLQQATENESLAREIQGSHNDWAIVAIFYAALHYVDMYFSGQSPPRTFRSHGQRNESVMTSLTPIHSDYMALLDESRYARYDCVDIESSEVDDYRNNELGRIKKYLKSQGVNIP